MNYSSILAREKRTHAMGEGGSRTGGTSTDDNFRMRSWYHAGSSSTFAPWQSRVRMILKRISPGAPGAIFNQYEDGQRAGASVA